MNCGELKRNFLYLFINFLNSLVHFQGIQCTQKMYFYSLIHSFIHWFILQHAAGPENKRSECLEAAHKGNWLVLILQYKVKGDTLPVFRGAQMFDWIPVAFLMTRRFWGARLCQRAMLLAHAPGARIAGANRQEAERFGRESQILESNDRNECEEPLSSVLGCQNPTGVPHRSLHQCRSISMKKAFTEAITEFFVCLLCFVSTL